MGPADSVVMLRSAQSLPAGTRDSRFGSTRIVDRAGLRCAVGRVGTFAMRAPVACLVSLLLLAVLGAVTGLHRPMHTTRRGTSTTPGMTSHPALLPLLGTPWHWGHAKTVEHRTRARPMTALRGRSARLLPQERHHRPRFSALKLWPGGRRAGRSRR